MPHGPRKLILIRAGRYDYAEVELSGSLQIVGPNNTGKTTLINTLQFLYLDDRRHMDFGSYTPEQTRDYYFPNQYSYILFECLGARGQFILGWRGQSKASGGEPERFMYEGPYDAVDFIDEHNQVRESKAVSARLTRRQYTMLKTAQDHREILLLATRGEGRGLGLVALRDNDKYPQFRETLKNLLYLSTISQNEMRDRLLMLADLSTEKVALDVRDLFGEDYDKIIERKKKLIRFKNYRKQVESLVDTYARRETLRGELMYRWSDLRAKRQACQQQHAAKVAKLRAEGDAAAKAIQIHQDDLNDRQNEQKSLSEAKGALQSKLGELVRQAQDFRDFMEEIERASLRNVEFEVRRIERQLGNAEKESRAKVEQKIEHYGKLVQQKHQTIAQFDRALVTILRRDLSDQELASLAQLFNFELLHQPVGDDGTRLRNRKEFVRVLRALTQRIHNGIYTDANIDLPLPASTHTIADLASPDAVRELVAEDEDALKRWTDILEAIEKKEALTKQLDQGHENQTKIQQRFFGWEQFQKAKAEEPRLRTELRQTQHALAAVGERMSDLGKLIKTAQTDETNASNGIITEENSFKTVMNRFSECVFPEFPGKPQTPDETMADDFDGAIDFFLRDQKKLTRLDGDVHDLFHAVESALGSDYVGADEIETLRLLEEELEGLPEQEDTLRRDWDYQFHQLRATFHQVLADVDRLHTAATELNRAFARIRVSNLSSITMKVEEQADRVGSLRRLADVEQPGLFEDSTSLETALGSFRQKFETDPLLRYADLFTLRFTVTGDDGKPHHYHDFRQVESHGTTITIKVLFNLLVLRNVLREDVTKSLLSEIPFFLDEIHSLDETNRRAILVTARKLGFIAITAAPESVSEVDALYFLQPRQGRIVLRRPHRIGVKIHARTA